MVFWKYNTHMALMLLTPFSRFWQFLRTRLPFARKIRNKLLFMVLILTAINFIFFALLAMRSETSYILWHAEQQTTANTRELTHAISSAFTQYLREIAIAMEQWTTTDFDNSQDMQSSFQKLLAASDQILSVSLLHANHDLVFHIHRKGFEHTGNVRFTPQNAIVLDNHFQAGQIYYFPASRKIALLLCYHSQRQSKYLFTILFDLTPLIQMAANWKTGNASEIIIINPLGEVLYHPRQAAGTLVDPVHFALHNQWLLLHNHHHNDFSHAATKAAVVLNARKERILRIYAPCPPLNWGIFVEQNTRIFHQRIVRTRWIMLALMLGPLLVTLSLGLLFVHQVIRPLEMLEDGIKLFEAGLLAESLPVYSRDEIGRLTQSFNHMVQTLITRNEEIQRKNRNLAFLNEITSIINQSIDLNTFLDSGLRKILQTAQASAGWIYVFDPQLKRLGLIAYQGISDHFLPQLQNSSFAETLMERSCQSGKPSLIRDISSHLPATGLEPWQAIRELLLIPLRSKKRIVGLLAIASNQKYFFHHKDLDQLAHIGSELGIAIENALLYIELQLKIKEREEVNKDLQEMDRFKNRILSNVSHELRTPLTSIKTYVDLFLNDKIGSLHQEQKDKLKIVSRNVNNLLNLINDLLTLARIQDQKLLLRNLEVLVLQELVDQTIAETVEMARAKGLTLTREGLQEPALVRINRQKIHQVLQNLISNAIKFTEAGSIKVYLRRIEAEGETRERRIEINVSDTGIGIPKKSIKKIFQRFYQVDSSSTRKYVGTGLGLAIVKEVVEAHGSSIEVESRINQGSRFWFTLPAVTLPAINADTVQTSRFLRRENHTTENEE
ncbi:GAF domain-containing protein [candidate division FCPU426 bacterium]|nr:GAF domain-containing protein [candidate division FCPU426 bacterium]